jgi:hypothetical protein
VCKLFSSSKISLAFDGFCNWTHLSTRIKMHEHFSVHIQGMHTWLKMEKQCVFVRIVTVILYLAEHNLAFRGSSDVLNSSHNGNFLSLIELLAKFDPVLRDHINIAVENKTSQRNKHYLSHTFQNRIINAMGNKVKKKNNY